MPTYTYSCQDCGPFNLVRTIAQRSDPTWCPECGSEGHRAFTAPYLSRVNHALEAAIATAGISSETPAVTRHIPPAARPPAPSRPRSAPLPRI